MKKVISILLAVATLAFATSALADTTTTSTVANQSSTYTSFVASSSSTSSMPCFRQGDTVSFTISGVAVDDVITLATYKYNEAVSNATMQYIDEIIATNTTQAITYKVRDTATGVYKLVIRVGENALYEAYYKIGNVKATLISQESLTGSGLSWAYKIREDEETHKYTAAFIGKVTMDSNVFNLADIYAEPGFAITVGEDRKTFNFGDGHSGGMAVSAMGIGGDDVHSYVADTTSAGAWTGIDGVKNWKIPASSELYGGYSFVYAMNVYNIDTESNAQAIVAEALTDVE